jgi:hypothetical protein
MMQESAMQTSHLAVLALALRAGGAIENELRT